MLYDKPVTTISLEYDVYVYFSDFYINNHSVISSE